TATLPGPVGEAGVTLAAFGPDGTLAVGYDNGDIRLWDTATEKTTRIPHGPGDGTGGVSALAFGPGRTLAVGAANSDVYLWPVKS
ncbi:MAG TPA: hypothetical protein VGD91_12870, partial [Trebonia sp.]